MSLQNALKQLFTEVDGALACAVVDLNSRRTLGVHYNATHITQAFIEAAMAAAVDMFRGRTISTIEKVMAAHHGTKVKRTLREVQMTTDGTSHFMTVVEGKADALLVLISHRSANLGKGWVALRQASAEIGPFCP